MGWTGGLNHGFVVTAYLEDVADGGGGFVYWPGSHQRVHDYFCQHPDQVDGSFNGQPEFEALNRRYCTAEAGVQFIGKPGDCIIWHGGLMHSGSANATPTPR